MCQFDSEGNHVSVDDDYWWSDEVHELVNQSLNIEIQKIDDYPTNDDYKAKEKIVSVMIPRFEREEKEED